MARALRVAVVILLGLFGAAQDATEFSALESLLHLRVFQLD